MDNRLAIPASAPSVGADVRGRHEGGGMAHGMGDQARRLVRRHRRALAALSAAVAVLALGTALRPPPAATRPVLVAARDLPVGHRLVATDLAAARVPSGVALPGAATDPGGLVDRVLAGSVLRGEPVTATRLVPGAGGNGGWATPAGTQPMPVRFSDPAADALLSAGTAIDVLAAQAPAVDLEGASAGYVPARVVAEGVLVLAVLGSAEEPEGLLPSVGAAGDRSDPVVLAVTRDQALALAAAQAGSRLMFALAAR